MSLFKMVEEERGYFYGRNYGSKRVRSYDVLQEIDRPTINNRAEAHRLATIFNREPILTNLIDKAEIVKYWLTRERCGEMGTYILNINDARKACSRIDDGRMWGDTKKSNPVWYQEIKVK